MAKTSHIPPGEHTVLTLAMSKEDKRVLKMFAAERDMTVARLVHEWIQEHLAAQGSKEQEGEDHAGTDE